MHDPDPDHGPSEARLAPGRQPGGGDERTAGAARNERRAAQVRAQNASTFEVWPDTMSSSPLVT